MRSAMRAALALAAGASATVTELQCADAGCAGCTTAQTWEEGKCIPAGNAEPYHASQKATVGGGVVEFASYAGGSCAGAAVQTDRRTLGECAYFTGAIWTKFTASARANATLAVGACGAGCSVNTECAGECAFCMGGRCGAGCGQACTTDAGCLDANCGVCAAQGAGRVCTGGGPAPPAPAPAPAPPAPPAAGACGASCAVNTECTGACVLCMGGRCGQGCAQACAADGDCRDANCQRCAAGRCGSAPPAPPPATPAPRLPGRCGMLCVADANCGGSAGVAACGACKPQAGHSSCDNDGCACQA